MIFHFLDQHRWWFIVTMSAVTWMATAAVMVGLSATGSAEFTGPASIAAAIAIVATSIYFLCSSHLLRVWTLFRLRRQIAKREAFLEEIASKLSTAEKDALRWHDVHPVEVELREVLDMATEQERGALQTLTLARGTNPKDLEMRIRSLGTPLWEEWMRRFRGVASYRDYEVVVRTAAAEMDVATDKGYAQAELEAALMRRIFSARLALLQPEDAERVLNVWRGFALDHGDSLSAAVPASSPDQEKDLAGAGTYAMATVLAGAVVHERGLTLPTSFFQGVSAMLPPLVGALGWRITAGSSARFFRFWRMRRVLPAVVLVARMRSGLRVRRASHMQKLDTEQANLRRTAEFVNGQLLDLREQEAHLAQLKFSMRRLRMVIPLA
ncbi:hypothetical protein [Congregicoccus parvus]|jgi:uncharacterized protein YaaW (UPF0174 family)|uniref:hypothetical protein n=1 Tax=Congregicoccus parvus TaxID=3081749 RepID=UPI003FA565F1